MEKIAFLGLGNMGAPMARRLLDAGYPLTVWNRTRARTAPLAQAGAAVAQSPADAVRDADVVITMLADPAAAREVVAALAPALRPDAKLVEMSTVGPDALRELAALLPAGMTLVDAPVMGSVDLAADGSLLIYAGGDADAVAGVLAHLGKVTHCGPAGSGAALKLVLINAAIGGVTLVGEALALADAFGLPQQQVLESLWQGPVGGAARRAFAPASHFPVALAAKDVALATAVTDLPVLRAVHERLAAFPEIASDDLRRVVELIRAGRRDS
jgi:3-hydroxyisobutyrate dehydrogenase